MCIHVGDETLDVSSSSLSGRSHPLFFISSFISWTCCGGTSWVGGLEHSSHFAQFLLCSVENFLWAQPSWTMTEKEQGQELGGRAPWIQKALVTSQTLPEICLYPICLALSRAMIQMENSFGRLFKGPCWYILWRRLTRSQSAVWCWVHSLQTASIRKQLTFEISMEEGCCPHSCWPMTVSTLTLTLPSILCPPLIATLSSHPDSSSQYKIKRMDFGQLG